MIAVISGASKGIGKAIAIQLNQMGYDLVLIARNEERLIALKHQLQQAREAGKFRLYAVDLTDEAAVKKMTDEIAQLENLAVIVNNLGVYHLSNAAETTVDEVEQQIRQNLSSAIWLTQPLILSLRKSPKANIINIASQLSLGIRTSATAYSISKHAFKAWSDSLCEELRVENIKVSGIFPGSVNTPSWDEVPNAPRSKMVQPEDVAIMVAAILQLSDQALLSDVSIVPLDEEI